MSWKKVNILTKKKNLWNHGQITHIQQQVKLEDPRVQNQQDMETGKGKVELVIFKIKSLSNTV
jgi:hypothetical protein